MAQPQGNSTANGGRLDGSLNIVAPTASSVVLGAGWGASATVAFTAGSTDQRGEMTITSAGAGQAQATATVVFTFADGGYVNTPFAIVQLENSSNAVNDPGPTAQSCSKTALSFTSGVLPVTAKTYKYSYVVIA